MRKCISSGSLCSLHTARDFKRRGKVAVCCFFSMAESVWQVCLLKRQDTESYKYRLT